MKSDFWRRPSSCYSVISNTRVSNPAQNLPFCYHSCSTRAQSSLTRSGFIPPQNPSLAAFPSTHWVQAVNFLSLVFLWYSPIYLSDLVHVYFPSRQLRSSEARALRIPCVKTEIFGHRCLSYAAPSVCSSLPHNIRQIQSTTAFKTALKSHRKSV